MSDEMRGYVCVPSTPGLRTLTMRDGCRVSVMGLTEILEAIYAEGRRADPETADEILERLEKTNYIPFSSRQEYCDVLIEEYKKYVGSRTGDTGQGKQT
jgi:hypothetical protein